MPTNLFICMTQRLFFPIYCLLGLTMLFLVAQSCNSKTDTMRPVDLAKKRGITAERGYIVGSVDSLPIDQQLLQLKNSQQTLERFREEHKTKMNAAALLDLQKKLGKIQYKIDSLSALQQPNK